MLGKREDPVNRAPPPFAASGQDAPFGDNSGRFEYYGGPQFQPQAQNWAAPAASNSFGGFKSNPQAHMGHVSMSSPGSVPFGSYGAPVRSPFNGQATFAPQEQGYEAEYDMDEDYDLSQQLLCDEKLDFSSAAGQPAFQLSGVGIDFRRPGAGWTRMPSPPRSTAQTPSDGESDMEPYLRSKDAKRGPLMSLLTPNSKTGTGRNTPDTPFQERARVRPTKCRDPRLVSNLKTDEERHQLEMLFSNWISLQKAEEATPNVELSGCGTRFWGIRAMLVNWICEVCVEFSFRRQTFHSAVNLLDLFFHFHEPSSVDPEDYTHIGTAVVDLAIRNEETDEGAVRDFEMNSMKLNGEQFLNRCGKFVTQLLKDADYSIHIPTAYEWLRLYSQLGALMEEAQPSYNEGIYSAERKDNNLWERKFQRQRFQLALRYLDALVHHVKSRRFPNSLLAATMFAWKMAMGSHHHLEMCTGYTQEQIRDCYDWFEEELRPLLETGGAASEEVWNETMDDDDVIQKVNPMNMHVVLKAWGLDGGEEGASDEDDEEQSDQSEEEDEG